MKLGINLPIGKGYGWGICGEQLSKHLPQEWFKLTGEQAFVLPCNYDLVKQDYSESEMAALGIDPQLAKFVGDPLYSGSSVSVDFPGIVLGAAEGHALSRSGKMLKGLQNYGYFFVEDDDSFFSMASMDEWTGLIAGSNFNKALAAKKFSKEPPVVFQGVDSQIWRPAYLVGKVTQPFTIFSGGKFEKRKGQDIVIAAFRTLQTEMPDSRLMFAWNNPWALSASTMNTSPYIECRIQVTGVNGVRPGDFLYILAANGIDTSRVSPLWGSHTQIAEAITQRANVAVFPNRVEGGTNLVLMECIAAGIPVVMHPHSGQEDMSEWASYLCEDTPESVVQGVQYVRENYKKLEARAVDRAYEFHRRYSWQASAHRMAKTLYKLSQEEA